MTAVGQGGKYSMLPSLPEDMESPMLAGVEGYEWAAAGNLDVLFTRIYRFWAGKGLQAQVLSGALNLAALAFTVGFSGFLLLGVNWHTLLTAQCITEDTCDIASVALNTRPLASRGLLVDLLILAYLAIFGAYWLWSAMHYISDARDMLEAKHWVSNKLGVSDRGVGLMTWAELLHKLVVLQRTTRLCMARDLDEHDIVSRVMRKDNYMIALVNKGVLRLTTPPVTSILAAAFQAMLKGCAHYAARALSAAARACQPEVPAHTDSTPALPTNSQRNGQHLSQDGRHAIGQGFEAISNWLTAYASNRGGLGPTLNMNARRTSRNTLLGGRKPVMTKTLEWNLRWCVLDYMFDENFCVRSDFLEQPEKLKQPALLINQQLVALEKGICRTVTWLRRAAIVNAVLSPFLLLFLLLYFFLRNAERFYHHPGSAGSRRWSALARWQLREFNELPHYIAHRLDAAYAPSCHYVSQFPSHTIASVARFVAFIAGSFTALLLLLTMLDERLLERPLLGRHLVWWLASLGVVLTASRSFVNEEPVAYDPERAMQEVVIHTHYLPRHWRGRAHTAEVQAAFNNLFQYKVLLFLEELASVVLTPFMLYFTLPQCADDIVKFVSDFTTHVEGVGDVCSLACFDLQAHGNPKYGAPMLPGGPVRKAARSRQGKMEKSLLTFMATYPTWEPGLSGKQMLMSLSLQQQHAPHPQPRHNSMVASSILASSVTGHNTYTVGNGLDSQYPGIQSHVIHSDTASLQGKHQADEESGSGQVVNGSDHHSTELEQQAGQPHQWQQPIVLEPPPINGTTAYGTLGLNGREQLPSLQTGTSPDAANENLRMQGTATSEHNGVYPDQEHDILGQSDAQQVAGLPQQQGSVAGLWGDLAGQLHNSVFGVPVVPPLPLLSEQETSSNVDPSCSQPHSSQNGHSQHAPGLQLQEHPQSPGSDRYGNAGQAIAITIPPQQGVETSEVWSLVSTPALLLPCNETQELTRRLAQGHAMLQGLYEQSDPAVQHRRLAHVASAAAGGVAGLGSSCSASLWSSFHGFQTSSSGYGYPQQSGIGMHPQWQYAHSNQGLQAPHHASMAQHTLHPVHTSTQGAIHWHSNQSRALARASAYTQGRYAQQTARHSGMLHHHGPASNTAWPINNQYDRPGSVMRGGGEPLGFLGL